MALPKGEAGAAAEAATSFITGTASPVKLCAGLLKGELVGLGGVGGVGIGLLIGGVGADTTGTAGGGGVGVAGADRGAAG